MKNLLQNGKDVLEAGRAAVFEKKTSHHIVRFCYRSEGEELLCCESEPITLPAAEALRTSLGPAVKSWIFHNKNPPSMLPPYRLVCFPHTADPFESVEEGSARYETT